MLATNRNEGRKEQMSERMNGKYQTYRQEQWFSPGVARENALGASGNTRAQTPPQNNVEQNL